MVLVRVTVILTVYNEERMVTRAVGSLFNQTLDDIELLVIDDGSDDATPTVLAGIAQHDDRVRVIRVERIGRARALALACKEARGEFIANLDADDIAYPERLARQVAFLDSHPYHAWVGCAEERRDTQRNEHIVRTYPIADADIRRQSSKCIPYSHSGITFRRSLIDEGINYDGAQPYLIDFEFFLRVARQYKVANLPDVLVCRYVRNESFFQSRFKTTKQNRRLAWLGLRAVMWFNLPWRYTVFPIARLFYPYLPNLFKRSVRRYQGLAEVDGASG
ncbi:Glycosyltransferase involved in cell wall bisynthesis [Franzmannia pantelleriensis]|uniref:Glycosyltransferase involved in cell wall bisynthesis n=1 Tax=Franzmannia pantelleriensis TaxID=48727 RepID=A0A1G9ESU0_9GAMM|nr:glycosyltransferase family 2 protein [Halomonas pantelleriensis]SDK79121.1 Glycosyltransferase involved in cell wall bisynthesis [Halomonas pantelleriensis]